MTCKNALLKVVILGDGGVGKSCLMHRYVNNKFEDNAFHTVGVEFLNKVIDIDDKTFILQIWDTAGQERFKSLRTPFYRGTDLCLLVYSIVDRASFNRLGEWKKEFVQYADIKNPSSFPFVVLGNMVDLRKGEEEVSFEEGLSWCRDNGNLPYIETSAKEATNVDEAFVTGVRIWMTLEDKQEKICDSETVKLRNQEPTGITSCCLTANS